MSRYRITLNPEPCVGDKLCSEEAPETFAVDDDGKVFLVDPEGDRPEYILAAAKVCPFEAITLYDAESGQRVWPRG